MYWAGWEQELFEPRISRLIRTCSLSELCRISFDPKLSESLLKEYQGKAPCPQSFFQRQKINKFSQDFTIDELIAFKGKKYQQQREQHPQHGNPQLRKMLRIKLDKEGVKDESTRKKLWLEFTGFYALGNRYQLLKKMSFTGSFEQTIQLDLKRTKGSPQLLNSAHSVLSALAKYNSLLGYCQGLNFVAVFLLEQGFSEDETFGIMRYLCNEVVPLDYYTNMVSMFSDKIILIELLRYFNRGLYTRIRKYDSDIGSMVFPWFICLFAKGDFSREITKVVWDYLMVDGFVAIYKAGLVMLNLLEPAIAAHPDFAQAILACQERIRSFNDPEPFKKGMSRFYLDYRIIQLCRVAVSDREQGQLLGPIMKHQKPRIVDCRPDYHICLQNVENEKAACNIHTIFTFRKKPGVRIIPDYLDRIETKYFSKNSKYLREEDGLMLVRSGHVCAKAEELDEEFDVGRIAVFTKEIVEAAKIRVYKDPTSKIVKNKTMPKSESMAFLEMMMENQSFSNLLDLAEVQGEDESATDTEKSTEGLST